MFYIAWEMGNRVLVKTIDVVELYEKLRDDSECGDVCAEGIDIGNGLLTYVNDKETNSNSNEAEKTEESKDKEEHTATYPYVASIGKNL